MEDGKEERLGLTLGRTMVFHGEGAVLSPLSANGKMPTEEDGCGPFQHQKQLPPSLVKLGSAAFQQETDTTQLSYRTWRNQAGTRSTPPSLLSDFYRPEGAMGSIGNEEASLILPSCAPCEYSEQQGVSTGAVVA